MSALPTLNRFGQLARWMLEQGACAPCAKRFASAATHAELHRRPWVNPGDCLTPERTPSCRERVVAAWGNRPGAYGVNER